MSSDHAHFEKLDAVNRYLAGELDAEESQAFQDHFMQCEQCLELMELEQSFATSVKTQAAEGKDSEPSAYRNSPLLIMAAVLLLAANLYLVSIQLRRQAQPVQVSVETLTRNRGTDSESYKLAKGDAWLVLRLPLPESGKTFEVTLATPAGEPVWRTTLAPSDHQLEFAIPTELLPLSMYQLILRDLETQVEDKYRFTIERDRSE